MSSKDSDPSQIEEVESESTVEFEVDNPKESNQNDTD